MYSYINKTNVYIYITFSSSFRIYRYLLKQSKHEFNHDRVLNTIMYSQIKITLALKRNLTHLSYIRKKNSIKI